MIDNNKRKFTFRLYSISLEAVRLTMRVVHEIARHDADLADQAKRAATSWHLNIAEGMDAPGKLRNLRFRSALGSVNEVIACCDLAVVLGYVELTEEEADAMQHVRATLLNLVRPRQ